MLEYQMCFPLSLSQQNIWNLEQAIPGTPVNNISTTVKIRGHLDFPLLQESIHRVLESDSSLHLRLMVSEGRVMQYRAPYRREEFPVYDFTGTSQEGFENWEMAVSQERFTLENSPLYQFILFRNGEGTGGVLVKIHHIISDGWSQVAVCNKLAQTYLDLLAGKEPHLETTPGYELHVQEEENYLHSRAFQKDENYWKQALENMGEPSVLKDVGSAAVSPVGRRRSFRLPQVLNHAIYSYCQEKRVAPFAVFYMALAIYFKRIGGSEKFTIGVPIFNRTNYIFKQSTGMFVTTLPFVNQIQDEWTLNQFNKELMERWYEILRHQRYPFSYITRLAGTDSRLFQIALSYQDSKILENRDTAVCFSGSWHYSGYQAEQLTIHLTNLEDHRKYSVDYDYLTQFFSEKEIDKLHHSLCHILSEALSDPEKPIYRLNVLSMEEKEALLYRFNDTDRYLKEQGVYQALLSGSRRYLNRVALIRNGERLTYGSLMYLAGHFAGAIGAAGTKSNDLVAILLPKTFNLFAAMVGTLQANCAYLVLSDSLPEERIRQILKQSGAAVLVTDEKGKDRFADLQLPVVYEDEALLYTEGVPARSEQELLPPAQRLAYVVYTSGSTGEPKGVEITHENLLNLAQEMDPIYGQGAVLSVCNMGFDAFMLESTVAFLNGRTVVLPSEEALESPSQLAALINGYAVSTFAMTPSRLTALLRNKEFQRALQRMESIICGGEAFPADLLKKLKAVTYARIYNQYGPSETTVGVSIKELNHAESITAGAPMGNCRLYVLDKWKNPIPAGGIGELHIGGKCVGLGYRGRPDLTQNSFSDSPFVVGERLYATGDVASWTERGEIRILGRADSQIKLRGLRIELQEIVSCLESFPGIRQAAAKLCQLPSGAALGAYYCADEPINEAAVLSYVSTYLPRYMIPEFLMKLPRIPLNANGKADLARLPLPRGEGPVSDVLLSHTAAAVLAVFRSVLNTDDLHGNSDYFLCGGNSLNAMETVMELEEQTGRRVRLSDLYACRTARKLADFLEGGYPNPMGDAPADRQIKKAVPRDKYPLSPIQQGIYIQSFADPSGISYNMPGAFRLASPPDREKLEQALKTIIRQDPLLSSYFVAEEDGVFARVAEQVSFTVETLEGTEFDAVTRAFVRPFDLSVAPLLRAGLWRDPEGEWLLLLDSHHIISDGMSTPLLLSRLDQAYSQGRCSIAWTYYDYLDFCRRNQSAVDRETALSYWKERLQGLPDPLCLPGDFPRPKRFDYRGETLEWTLPSDLSDACRAFCRKRGISEFVLFLAAYGLLLSRISGREDFVIGAPVAGRNVFGAEQIFGPFINTLPLRLMPEGNMTVAAWLDRVTGEVTGMLDHQVVSLEEIISALDLPRNTQNGLYQVMMTQSPVDEDAFTLDGEKMVYRPVSTGGVKMDMVLELALKAEQAVLRFSYATGIFAKETAAFYLRCLRQILTQLTGQQERLLKQMSVLDPEDYRNFIQIPNYTTFPFLNLPIHKLLQNRVHTMNDETAVIFHDQSVSYRQLERRACAIASFLREQGITAGDCVGLCLSRTPDMIAAMYGVLKAGASYMYMLPDFPAARSFYMLQTAGAGLLLYDGSAKDRMPQEFWQGQSPCPTAPVPEGEAEEFEDCPVMGEHLTNIHFTSGSTGKPKGVMMRHRGVSNLYAQVESLLAPYPGKVLCSTNSVFDCFLVETLVALALGRTVVLADEEEMMLPWELARLVSGHEIAVFEMTPARLQMCFSNEDFCRAASHIKVLLVGGETLTGSLQKQFYRHCQGQLINMYGPSESTIYTSSYPLGPEDPITIGKPLQNIRTYVLDEQGHPVIPTACGELYLAGECLAAGYVSRPDLTQEAFLEDPYFPGEKMYRTGDMVRLRVDGNYDFLGRKDEQVKLNGQRVELTEITGAILETGLARQAATVAVRKEDGTMELCAFYESEKPTDREAEILEHLRRILPTYMIPGRLVRLEAMPMTASNKIDLRKLSETASSNAEQIPVEQETPQASVAVRIPQQPGSLEYILTVWSRVIGVPLTDPETSFFRQGGSSMAALNVLSRYYNDGLEMSLAEFYENPTAAAQEKLLRRSPQGSEPTCAIPAEDFGLAASNCVGQQKDEKTVLVTGATGFFGAHLVKELLSDGHTKVLCLVRNGGRDRLERCLSGYFGEGLLSQIEQRLSVIEGDITRPLLGLSLEDWERLATGIHRIYHSAADVRHYADDTESYLQTNVGGTENILALARWGNVPFCHISTCSVSGERARDSLSPQEFTEHDYDIGQFRDDNIYVRSKFLAEGAVRKAAEKGLQTKIFRLGRLVGRNSDGVFQRNPQTNAFYLLLRSFCQLGVLPESAADIRLDVMPVDLSAREVLALEQGRLPVYHILNPDPTALKDIVRAFPHKLTLVSDEAFQEILEGNGSKMDRELCGILMDYLHQKKRDRQEIPAVNRETTDELMQMGFDMHIAPLELILRDFFGA